MENPFKKKSISETLDVSEFTVNKSVITKVFKQLTAIETAYEKMQKRLEQLDAEEQALKNETVDTSKGIDSVITDIANTVRRFKQTSEPLIEYEKNKLAEWWEIYSSESLNSIHSELNSELITLQASIDLLLAEYMTAKNSAELTAYLSDELLETVMPVIEKYNSIKRLAKGNVRTLKEVQVLSHQEQLKKVEESAIQAEANRAEMQRQANERMIARGFEPYRY